MFRGIDQYGNVLIRWNGGQGKYGMSNFYDRHKDVDLEKKIKEYYPSKKHEVVDCITKFHDGNVVPSGVPSVVLQKFEEVKIKAANDKD